MTSNPLLNKSLNLTNDNNNLVLNGLNQSFSFMGWIKPDFSQDNATFTLISDPNNTEKENF